MAMRGRMSPSHSGFDEEFFMIFSWIDHVPALKFIDGCGQHAALTSRAYRVEPTTGRRNHGLDTDAKRAGVWRSYEAKRYRAHDSIPSHKRAALDQILRSLRGPARERVVLWLEQHR